jgi:hypothetical protein
MTQPLHQHSTHFASLLEHLSAFDETQRQRLAEMYTAGSAEPVDIALRWCRNPEMLNAVIERELGDSTAWLVLDQLAQEHDLPVEIDWVDAKSRAALIDIGMLKPKGYTAANQPAANQPAANQPAANQSAAGPSANATDVDWVPGAVAAILSPRLSGTRPTLPLLLGRQDHEDVVALAKEHEVSTEGSKVEIILRLSETFAAPEFIDFVLARLPQPDWIGAAMMTLELGGICYWREIFGHEVDDGTTADNVVPLMRSDERDEQRSIAEFLLELGVLFKIDDEAAELPLVALPEELWLGLWSLGQGWLLDWTAVTFTDIEDVAVRQQREPQAWDAQKVLKWLAYEASQGDLRADKGGEGFAQETIASLETKAAGLDINWEVVANLGFDLGLFDVQRKRITPNHEAFEVLDLPRAGFIREVLSAWGIGIVGSSADQALPEALGIDEDWVEHLVDIFSDHSESLAPWMTYPGVAHMETGAGCLREVDEDDEDFMLLELGLTNTCLCLAKVHWLDLLSLLEANEWYSVQGLRDLLQMTSAFAVFSQLGHIIQDPHSNYYFPVLRPSFLTPPMQTEPFDDWIGDIVTGLLEPLGVARFSDDGERLWLDTRQLRVPSPPDWPEEPRLQLVREVLADPSFEFIVPEINGASLRSVPEFDDHDTVHLDLPVQAIFDACQGRDVANFEATALRLR